VNEINGGRRRVERRKAKMFASLLERENGQHKYYAGLFADILPEYTIGVAA